ncbi:hypothetical protein C8Q75DRAFT_735225 [Abortiporus biennis]|nr:hypothetical protein C8Q75DRAFT_735225 [Abortiporus biennis]
MPLDPEEEEAYNRKQLEEDEGASLVTITCPPKSLKRLALDNVMISGKDHAECAFIVAQFLNAFSTIDHLYCNKVGFYATCQIDINYNDWEEMLEEASEVIGEHFEVGMISVSAKPEQTKWFLYLISFTPKADSMTSFYAQITEECDTGSIHTMFQCFEHSLEELIFDTFVDPPNSDMLRKTWFPLFDYGALLKLHTVRMLFPCNPTPPLTDDNSLESIVDSITALLEGVRDDTIEHLSLEFTSIPLRFQVNETARLNEWSENLNRIISRKFEKSFEELSFVFWQHTYNEDTRNFENLIETEFSEFDKKAMLRIEIHPIDECQIRPRMRIKWEKGEGEYVYSRAEGKEE